MLFFSSDGFPLLRDLFVGVTSIILTYLVSTAYAIVYPSVLENYKSKDQPSLPFASNHSNNGHNAPNCISPKTSLAIDPSTDIIQQCSGSFLSAIFSQLWHHFNVAVSKCIKDTMEPMLMDLKVPMHFVKLDLGSVPIRTDNIFVQKIVKVGQNGEAMSGSNQGVQIDVDITWDGNCDILLQANLTKSAKFTFGVSHIKLSGRMQILLSPLTTDLPVISAVQYGFTNPPEIELSYAGCVEGITKQFSFVKDLLHSSIQKALASMLVLPYRMVYPMDLASYDYLETYRPPLGFVRVSAVKGRGFQVLKKVLVDDVPDIYCLIWVGASKMSRSPFRTSTQYDNLNPSWTNESSDFLLSDLDQIVYVDVYDENRSPMDSDEKLGAAQITVRDLMKKDGTAELELILDGSQKTGCYITLSADLFYLTKDLHSLTSLEHEGDHWFCGLVTIAVTRAFDIPCKKEEAATYVKVAYGNSDDLIFYTGTVEDYPGCDALNPMYDCVFYISVNADMMNDVHIPKIEGLVVSPSSSRNGRRARASFVQKISASIKKEYVGNPNDIILTLMNGKGHVSSHKNLGSITIPLDSLKQMKTNHTITERRLIGDDGASLEFRVVLEGMQSEGEGKPTNSNQVASPQTVSHISLPLTPSSAIKDDGPSPSQQVINENSGFGSPIRISILRGRGFKIRKRFGKKDDVPDVYVYCYLSHQQDQCWKTSTIKDDTMPNWNESRIFNSSDLDRDTIRIDVFDENRKSKDDYIGSAEYSLRKLLRMGGGRPMEMELRKGTIGTEAFVTIKCSQLTVAEETVKSSSSTSSQGKSNKLDEFSISSVLDDSISIGSQSDLLHVSSRRLTHPFSKAENIFDENASSTDVGDLRNKFSRTSSDNNTAHAYSEDHFPENGKKINGNDIRNSTRRGWSKKISKLKSIGKQSSIRRALRDAD